MLVYFKPATNVLGRILPEEYIILVMDLGEAGTYDARYNNAIIDSDIPKKVVREITKSIKDKFRVSDVLVEQES